LNSATDLEDHSASSFSYSLRKYSCAVILSAIFWISDPEDSSWLVRTDIFEIVTIIRKSPLQQQKQEREKSTKSIPHL
jgi:hypothetical protein